MRKVKMQLDALQVETFATTVAPRDARGTVHGRQPESLWAPEATCGDSCLDPNSCRGTCFCTHGEDC